MLRTKAILEQGGFTPGFFSDDLDMTIRLNLKGLKVVYAADIVMGEKHPSSYASLPNSEKLEIKGKDIYLDGNKFIIRGIQYSPWRSGTGPNKNYPYPAPNLITQDLTLISKMHVNTILVYDAPAFVLDLAKKRSSLCLLFILFQFIGTPWVQRILGMRKKKF
jgi:cellulose synthase/poly-beta-1,6-N-acetylglucosamine synthase-like glycosyltransferase